MPENLSNQKHSFESPRQHPEDSFKFKKERESVETEAKCLTKLLTENNNLKKAEIFFNFLKKEYGSNFTFKVLSQSRDNLIEIIGWGPQDKYHAQKKQISNWIQNLDPHKYKPKKIKIQTRR